MKLIVGLGNPGRVYANSRHNIGFGVVKALAKGQKTVLKKDRFTPALTAKLRVAEERIILAEPLTFMNLSGSAVGPLLKKYKIDLVDLLVVCDDLDLEFGRIKIRPDGSSGGHNGLVSIIETLGTKDFARLRVGIGRPKANMDSADYVLTPFSRQESPELKEIIERAADCCLTWIEQGLTRSMNLFNHRSNA